VNGWPASLASQFFEYRRDLKSGSGPSIATWGGPAESPYWIELPEWIPRGKSVDSAGGVQRLVRDVAWAQVCLFYAVRIEDDIFDGHLSRTPLALAPMLFLQESQLVFSTYFDGRSPFWEFYRKAIESTLEGILRVSELERDPMAPAEMLLRVYGDVDAIFSVGAAAVCEKLGMNSMLPALCTFVMKVGRVAQAMDDIDDLDEDLADGRFNYAAKVLLARSGSSMTRPELLRNNLNAEAQDAAMEEISASLHSCLDQACHAVGPLELPGALDLIEWYRRTVRQLSFKETIHTVRT